jgi:hypothetical protein
MVCVAPNRNGIDLKIVFIFESKNKKLKRGVKNGKQKAES